MREQYGNKRVYNVDQVQDIPNKIARRNERSKLKSQQTKTSATSKPGGFRRDSGKNGHSRSQNHNLGSDEVGNVIENVKQQQLILERAVHKLNTSSSNNDPSTAKQLKDMLSIVLEQTNKLQTKLPLITPGWSSTNGSPSRNANSNLKHHISPVRFPNCRSQEYNSNSFSTRQRVISPEKYKRSPAREKLDSVSKRRHELSPLRSRSQHYSISSVSRHYERERHSSRVCSESSRRSITPYRRQYRSPPKSSDYKKLSRYSISPVNTKSRKDVCHKHGLSMIKKKDSPVHSFTQEHDEDWDDDPWCKEDQDQIQSIKDYSVDWEESISTANSAKDFSLRKTDSRSPDLDQVEPSREDGWSNESKKISDYEIFKKKWEKEKAIMAEEIERLRREVSEMKRDRMDNREERDKQIIEDNNYRRQGKNISVKDRIGFTIHKQALENDQSDEIIAPKPLTERELEWEMEERKNRKKYLFIRGVRNRGKGVAEEIESLIEEAVGVRMNIASTRPLGQGVVVELWSFKNKMAVMKKRWQLKSWKIWIEDYLTEREREVQRWIEEQAKLEKNKGNEVRTGYLKIHLNGNWMLWNETKGRLEKSRWSGNESEGKWDLTEEECNSGDWEGNRWDN